MGNHDMLILQGYNFLATSAEMKEYAEYRATPMAKELIRRGYSAESAQYLAAFHGDTDIAKWMRTRNTLLRIGDTLFVHGGVGNWPATPAPW
jgi:hypothetical protein